MDINAKEKDILLKLFDFCGTYAVHKSACERVKKHSSCQCNCGYDENKKAVLELLKTVTPVKPVKPGESVLLRDVGFMHDVATDKIYVVDSNLYRGCTTGDDVKALVKWDVTGSMHVVLDMWLKKDG